MTGDELAALVFAEQGYFVMAAKRDHPVGTIIDPGRHGEHGMPMVIVGPSNRKEYLQQLEIGRRISPSTVGHAGNWPIYYRVEAAD